MLHIVSCNIAFIRLLEFGKSCLDEHTPIIEKRVNKHVQPPWVSNDIKEAIKKGTSTWKEHVGGIFGMIGVAIDARKTQPHQEN